MNPSQDPPPRQTALHFVDGNPVAIEWPSKTVDDTIVQEVVIEKAVASQRFATVVDGNLVVIPMASAKFFEMVPAPEKLPDTVIRSGKRVE